MRSRMTSRRRRVAEEPRGILAEIKEVERLLAAVDDSDLESEAQGLANEEEQVVSESTPADVQVPDEDILDENDKAMDNWPVEARREFAARLLRIASMVLAEEDEDGDDDGGDEEGD